MTMKFIAVTAVLIFFATTAHGCSCFPDHPQNQLCAENSFAALVKVRREDYVRTQPSADLEEEYFNEFTETTDGDGTFINRIIPKPTINDKIISKDELRYSDYRRYRVKIYQAFKGLDKVREELRSYLYTNNNDAMCGTTLTKKTTYFIIGKIYDGRLHFGLCDNVVEWNALPKAERQNIIANMEALESVCATDCQVQSCPWWDCTSTNETEECIWDKGMEGQYARKYQKVNFLCSRSVEGQCEWTGANIARMNRLTRTKRHHKSSHRRGKSVGRKHKMEP